MRRAAISALALIGCQQSFCSNGFVDEGVRCVLLFDADGEPTDEETMLYAANRNSVTLKLRIGAKVNAAFVDIGITRDMQDTGTVLLRASSS